MDEGARGRSSGAGRLLRWTKRAALAAAFVALLLAGLYATRERTLHPLLVRALPSLSRAFSGYEVRASDISGDWTGELEVTGLEVAPRGGGPLTRASMARVRVTGELLALARTGDLGNLDSLEVDDPDVAVDLGAQAEDASETDEPLELPALPRVAVTGGRIELAGAGPRVLLQGVDITCTGGSDGAEARVVLDAESDVWRAHVDATVVRENGRTLVFDADVDDLVARGVAARASGVHGRWSPGRALVESGVVEMGSNRATFAGVEIDTTSGEPLARGRLELELGALAEAQRVLGALELVPAKPAWSGRGSGTVDLEPAPGRVARGTVDLELLSASFAGYAAERLEVEVAGEPAGFRVAATDFIAPVESLGPIAQLDASGRWDDGRVELDALRAALVHGELEASGAVELANADTPLAIALDGASLTRGEDRIELERPARVSFPDEGVRVADVLIGGTAGRLALEVAPGVDGALEAELTAARLDLSPFVPELDETLQKAALRLTALDGTMRYTSAPFAVTGDLVLEAVVQRAGIEEPLRAEVRGVWDAERARVEALSLEAAGARVEGSAALDLAGETTVPDDAPLKLDLELDTGPRVARTALVADLVGPEAAALLERLDGEAHLSIHLGGTWSRATGTVGVTSDALRLAPPDGVEPLPYLDRPATVAVELAFGDALRLADGTARLGDAAEIALDLEVERALEPRAFAEDPSAAVDAWLGAGARGAATLETTSLEELRKLVPDVRETGGRLSATVDLAGSLGAPELTGSARLTEGTFRYRGAPPVVGAELEIEVSGDGITLTRGDLEVGSAPVALTGKVLMGQGNPRIVGATVKGSNVLLVRSRDARVRADLDLEIDGRVADLTVRGDVVLREGRIRSPIEFQSLLEGGGATPPTVSRGIELPAFGPPSVALALKVRTADPIRLEGRIARGGLRAELDVGGTAAEPRPTGSVFFDPLQLAVPAGTIDFTAGLVTFRPEDPELPTLDLVGETRLAGYDVTITVSGEYDRAEVELTSSPALSPDDLLLLVLTGQPPAAGAGLEAAGQSVALYVAKDLVRGWFASGGFEDEDRESFLDRLEVTTGRDVSRAGVLTVEATYRLKEGLARDKDALYVVLERDTYEDYGLGLRLVLRLD